MFSFRFVWWQIGKSGWFGGGFFCGKIWIFEFSWFVGKYWGKFLWRIILGRVLKLKRQLRKIRNVMYIRGFRSKSLNGRSYKSFELTTLVPRTKIRWRKSQFSNTKVQVLKKSITKCHIVFFSPSKSSLISPNFICWTFYFSFIFSVHNIIFFRNFSQFSFIDK